MISIKHFLDDTGRTNVTLQVAALLIEKLGECAVEGDPRELENFRGEMRAVRDAITPNLQPEKLLILAGSATQALETYNRRITKAIGLQGGEFQTIIKMLRDGLVKMAGESVQSVQSLNRIGGELERSNGFTDLESLKLHLGSCLTAFREEIEREKSASKAMVEGLQIQVETLREFAEKSPSRKLDAATKLSVQEDCVAAIRAAIAKGTRHHAVVMVVNRVQPINARFGREAGDRMLLAFRNYIEKQLDPSDRLFRWTGPAMVAIMERPQAPDQVRLLVKRMFDTPVQETLDIGSRSVLIPISAAWSVITLTSTPEAVDKQIEAFIAGRGGLDLARNPPYEPVAHPR
jgi:GGDEF domain-containing protein